MLFDIPAAQSSHLLTDKFRPQRIADFIGLEKPKKLCTRLAAAPFESRYIFHGEPGTGKTALALALASEMPAEVHHIASQECNLENLKDVVRACNYMPRAGCRMHLILVDEADQMSAAAQLYMLSKMDATAPIPQTICIFTANTLDGLHDRFVSRCLPVKFSSYGIAPEATELLARVWTSEAPANAAAPNFARIVKEATGNIRTSLMALQAELLMA